MHFQSDGDGSVFIAVKVQPGASKHEIVGLYGDLLKVRIAAPPEKGRANEALCRFLASVFGVRKTDVVVVSGQTNQNKRVRISGSSESVLRNALECIGVNLRVDDGEDSA